MKRTTRISTEHQEDIERALDRFGDHEGMSDARVLRWLAQFSDRDLPLAVQVIESVKYYNTVNVRAMTRQLYQIAVGELGGQGYNRLVFVPVGGPGAGSNTVARALRGLVRRTAHQLLSMVDLLTVQPGAADAIVFLDDFSGTGLTLEKWWENVEPLVRPTGAPVFVGLLVLNERARQRIEQFADVMAVDELDASADVFSPENASFSNDDKTRIFESCRRTGCSPDFQRGYGQCGLLLAFKHGCPNNSLPVLWYAGARWSPLFNRRAI